jgi:electron transport complex protein RnfD
MKTTIIEVRTSPHLHTNRSVPMIMRNVIYALIPLCLYGIWLFGISALFLIVTAVASCVLTEHIGCRILGRESTIGDGSAVVTGVLIGLILPPGLPLWMAALGGIIAIAPGKLIFGGLGFNLFNPAFVARAFLQAAFPVAITAYTPALARQRFSEFIPSTLAWPFMKAAPLGAWIQRVRIDAFTGATPLMQQKFEHVTTGSWPLLLGLRAGSAGETCIILIVLCGAYLIARRMMNWRIPLAMLTSAFLVSGAFRLLDPSHYPTPWFMLASGGLMLCAFFMATDPVGAPVTPKGVWIYGALVGFITVIIRLKGGLPEGVMYAILLGNALTPLIDDLTQPRTFGAPKKAKAVVA